MRRLWSDVAVDLERGVRATLVGAGGVDLARAAESKPEIRREVVLPALEALGVLELDPLGDEDESSAAVLAVKACGAVVAPWPVARVLSVPVERRDRLDALWLVDGPVVHLDHADLADRGAAVGVAAVRTDGVPRAVRATGPRAPVPLDPFGVPVEVGGPVGEELDVRAVLMGVVMDGFWVAGALETALSQAAAYAGERRQFGRPISSFGEIQWRLADMAVATDGLDELATYTWAQVRRDRADAADAWALRLGMLETADTVLRHAHQVFGAIGLCEEHDLAVLDRHLMPALARPAGRARTGQLLLGAVNHLGFRGTFDVAPRTVAGTSIPTK